MNIKKVIYHYSKNIFSLIKITNHMKRFLTLIVLILTLFVIKGISQIPDHLHKVRATYSGLSSGDITVNEAVIDELLDEILFSNSNTYLYLMGRVNNSHWIMLPYLLEKCNANNINVWVYLVPPSETYNGLLSPKPYGEDYITWVEAIAFLSLEYDNLTAFAIDDFDNNLDFFTPEYVTTMVETAHAINPNLCFIPVVYYREDFLLNPTRLNAYLPYISGILFPYTNGYGAVSNLYATDNFVTQIENIKSRLGSNKALIIDVYATGLNNWNSEPEYVQEITQTAYELTDGVCIFVLQTQKQMEDHEHFEKRMLTHSQYGDYAMNRQGLKQQIFLCSLVNSHINSSQFLPYMYKASWYDATQVQNFACHKFDVSGDFDGDFLDEIAIFYDYPYGNPRQQRIFGLGSSIVEGICSYRIVNQGGSQDMNSWYSSYSSTLDFDSIIFALSGDYDGDNIDEIALVYNGPSLTPTNYNVIYGFKYFTDENRMRNMGGAETGNAWYSRADNIFDFTKVLFAIPGDYDNDNIDEIAFIYDGVSAAPQGYQLIFGFKYFPNENRMHNVGGGDLGNAWYAVPSTTFNFNFVDFVVSGDFDNFPGDELAIFYDYIYPTNQYQRIFVFKYDPASKRMKNLGGVAAGNSWYATTSNLFNFDNIEHVVAGDYDSDGKSELAIFYDFNTFENDGYVHQRVYLFDKDNNTQQFIMIPGPQSNQSWIDYREDIHSFDDHVYCLAGNYYTEHTEDRWLGTSIRDEIAFFYSENSGKFEKSTVSKEFISITSKQNIKDISFNYPNPFNLITTIEYHLFSDSKVQIMVYDVHGRLVSVLVDDFQEKGIHKVVWNGDGYSPGIYFYKIIAGSIIETKSMIFNPL